jgi:hydrogenase maturation protease
MDKSAPRCVIVAIGNRDRGDDGAGPAVLDRLRGAELSARQVENAGDAAGLIAALEGAESAFLIDACVSGAEPGTVHRIDAGRGALPPGRSGLSSHGFGLADCIALARALGALPPFCIVYAVEGVRFDLGAGLSPPVARAVAAAASAIRAEIASWTDADSRG